GKWLRDFAEDMQQFYNISKEEVFSIERVFSDAGVGIGESIEKWADSSLGKVGRNLVTYSLALDKMFNLSTGTSAKGMISFAREFGMSMTAAKDSMTKAYFLGRQSGIGGEYFVSNLQKTATALSNLGISVDGVTDFLYILQNRLRDIGVPRHLAAKEAAAGLNQISQGLSKLSTDWKVILGEFLYKKEGLAAKHAFDDGMIRLVGNPIDFQKYVSKIVGFIRGRTSSDAQLREVLEKSGGGLGWGPSGARTALQFDEAYRSGDRVSMGKMKKEMETFRKDVKGSLDRQASTETKFRRAFNRWMKGLAKVGRGLLGLAISFMGRLYMAIQSIPIIVSNLFSGESGRRQNAALSAEMDRIGSAGMDIVGGEIKGGAEMMKDAGIEGGEAVLGDMLDNTIEMMTWDPKDVLSKMEDQTPKGPKKMPQPTSDLKVVAIPVQSTGEHKVHMPENPVNEKGLLEQVLGTSAKDTWKGHGARIINYGVDDSGNIMVGLVGDCPRCGLVLGKPQKNIMGSAFTSGIPGLDKSASMESRGDGVSISNVKTKEKAVVDLSDPGGLAKLSKMSVSQKARRKDAETVPLDPKLSKILGGISERFPGKEIKVYRGATEKGQAGQHSKGRAMDIAVEGVSNKDLFKYIRSNIKGGGKGYYPNQPFVHVDTRPGSAVWVDFSKPKQKGAEKLGGVEANKWLQENVGRERRRSEPNRTDLKDNDYFTGDAIPKKG
ncbi:DUF882 domain-containing protein, partial [bacterium]|nr:DUF882 domain-containing protein [bacterium]